MLYKKKLRRKKSRTPSELISDSICCTAQVN